MDKLWTDLNGRQMAIGYTGTSSIYRFFYLLILFSPWRDYDITNKVQGLVALTDSKGPTGGYHCVPGMHKRIKDWVVANESKKRSGGLINVPDDDPLRKEIEQVSLRK